MRFLKKKSKNSIYKYILLIIYLFISSISKIKLTSPAIN